MWTGSRDIYGYGKITVDYTTRRAHRLAYELLVGPIPAGLQLDHLCHTRDLSCAGGPECMHRRCINPHHLEPVTQRVNFLRGRTIAAGNVVKTQCPRGHAYTEANTRVDKNGKRNCRSCRPYWELKARAGRDDLPKCGATSRRGKICDRPVGHEGAHHPGFARTEARLEVAR